MLAIQLNPDFALGQTWVHQLNQVCENHLRRPDLKIQSIVYVLDALHVTAPRSAHLQADLHGGCLEIWSILDNIVD